jgi:hypothetical protein
LRPPKVKPEIADGDLVSSLQSQVAVVFAFFYLATEYYTVVPAANQTLHVVSVFLSLSPTGQVLVSYCTEYLART